MSGLVIDFRTQSSECVKLISVVQGVPENKYSNGSALVGGQFVLADLVRKKCQSKRANKGNFVWPMNWDRP